MNPKYQKLEDVFNTLDLRDVILHGPRISRNSQTNEITLIGIVARKVPRHFYTGEVADKHRLIMVKLVKELQLNGKTEIVTMEFPYTTLDLEHMWEFMFDVWVKEEKIKNYAKRFLKLINNKCLQRKLGGFAQAYLKELEN